MKQVSLKITLILALILISGLLPVTAAYAATAAEIDVSADAALERFVKEVKGAKEFFAAAKAILVIPRVIQAGFIIGGEYGEGALRIDGKTVDYYNIISASFGYQIGAQQKDIILIFMNNDSLTKFRTGENWQAGVDGTVAVLDIGAEGSIDTTKIKQPIVGFVFGQKGIMAGATIEGSKFTKLKK